MPAERALGELPGTSGSVSHVGPRNAGSSASISSSARVGMGTRLPSVASAHVTLDWPSVRWGTVLLPVCRTRWGRRVSAEVQAAVIGLAGVLLGHLASKWISDSGQRYGARIGTNSRDHDRCLECMKAAHACIRACRRVVRDVRENTPLQVPWVNIEEAFHTAGDISDLSAEWAMAAQYASFCSGLESFGRILPGVLDQTHSKSLLDHPLRTMEMAWSQMRTAINLDRSRRSRAS